MLKLKGRGAPEPCEVEWTGATVVDCRVDQPWKTNQVRTEGLRGCSPEWGLHQRASHHANLPSTEHPLHLSAQEQHCQPRSPYGAPETTCAVIICATFMWALSTRSQVTNRDSCLFPIRKANMSKLGVCLKQLNLVYKRIILRTTDMSSQQHQQTRGQPCGDRTATRRTATIGEQTLMGSDIGSRAEQ